VLAAAAGVIASPSNHMEFLDSESDQGGDLEDLEFSELVAQEPQPTLKEPKKKKKKNQTRKRKKDAAPKPKRAKTAYMFFSAAARPLVKQENPDADFSLLGKLVAERWKTTPDEEKEQFAQLAEKDRVRYEQEKDLIPKSPKKPKTAFMVFSNVKRAEIKQQHPEASFGDIGKILGVLWKQLPEEEKLPYASAAREDRQRYDVQRAEFDRVHGTPGLRHTPSPGLINGAVQYQVKVNTTTLKPEFSLPLSDQLNCPQFNPVLGYDLSDDEDFDDL